MQRITIFLIFLMVAAAGFTPARAEGAPPAWEWRNPLPQGFSFLDMTFGNGVFVALIEDDGIATSTNGVNWRREATIPSARKVSFGGGIFVVIDGGYAWTSADGHRWVRHEIADLPSLYVRDVAYGGGRFVVATSRGLFTSEDGAAWARTTSDSEWVLIVSSGSSFAARSMSGQIAVSGDGVAWREQPLLGPVRRVQFDGRQLAAFTERITDRAREVIGLAPSHPGITYISNDGQAWAPAPDSVDEVTDAVCSTEVCAALTFSDRQLLAAVETGPWAQRWIPSENQRRLSALAYGNGLFVAGGANGLLLTSTDGLTWRHQSSNLTEAYLTDVAFAGLTFVAVGGGAVVVSPDGVTWTAPAGAQGYSVKRVVTGNGRIVAVSGSDILTSADGEAWQVRKCPSSSFESIVWTGNRFLALDLQGRLFASEDGADWLQLPGGDLKNAGPLLFGAGKLYATRSLSVYTSDDGITWTELPGARRPGGAAVWEHLPGGGGPLYHVAGYFWTLARGGIFRSHDGSRWEPVLLGRYSTLAYGQGRLVAVGDHVVATSADMVHWEVSPFPVSNINRIAYGDGRWAAVGGGGTIITLTWPMSTMGSHMHTRR